MLLTKNQYIEKLPLIKKSMIQIIRRYIKECISDDYYKQLMEKLKRSHLDDCSVREIINFFDYNISWSDTEDGWEFWFRQQSILSYVILCFIKEKNIEYIALLESCVNVLAFQLNKDSLEDLGLLDIFNVFYQINNEFNIW
jgi:hypothetical protein